MALLLFVDFILFLSFINYYEVASYQNVVILAVIREAVYHFLSSQSNLNDSAVEIVHIFPFHRSV